MIERLAALPEAALDAAQTVSAALGGPLVTLWATMGAMPLPVALMACAVGAALFHTIDQRAARRKE